MVSSRKNSPIFLWCCELVRTQRIKWDFPWEAEPRGAESQVNKAANRWTFWEHYVPPRWGDWQLLQVLREERGNLWTAPKCANLPKQRTGHGEVAMAATHHVEKHRNVHEQAVFVGENSTQHFQGTSTSSWGGGANVVTRTQNNVLSYECRLGTDGRSW